MCHKYVTNLVCPVLFLKTSHNIVENFVDKTLASTTTSLVAVVNTQKRKSYTRGALLERKPYTKGRGKLNPPPQ